MVKAIMHGCNGKMGQVITGLAAADDNIEIVAGIDVFDDGHNSYPVFSNLNDCNVKADVIIDFASAKAIDGLLDYCETTHMPLVLCTTGLSEEQIARVSEVSKVTPVLRSANMSLGINTLFKVLKSVAPLLADAGFDIEIVEKHHHFKLDAPSGTAIGDRAMRPKNEIGISAVRGGTIVGEHEVIFAGEDEVIEFKHTAYSKSVFAKGAIEAAKFLAGKPAGLYTMKEVIG